MRYHIQPRLKYWQPDAGEGGPDVDTLNGRRITRLQELGQDPQDVEDEWNTDDMTRIHSDPWTGTTFFPLSQPDDNVVLDVSGSLPLQQQEGPQ